MIEFQLAGDVYRAMKLAKAIIYGQIKPTGKVTLLGCDFPVGDARGPLGQRLLHEMEITARGGMVWNPPQLWRQRTVQWPFAVEGEEDQMLLMMAW